ncbi:MAG: potassium channel family protein [Armatimonadota bacterium]|jgi:voltage-gated potassium channel
MKGLSSQLAFILGSFPVRRNVGQLLRLLALLVVLILIYSVAFHYLMEYEGRSGEFTWFTGFYWTLTVMSTLGYGDITFQTDLGRAFSTLVLVTGLVSLLVIFPFTFIQFFWAPWLEAQRNAQAPRELPADVRGHVILTARDPVSASLLRHLQQYQVPHVMIVPTVDEALSLHDEGYQVMVGEPDRADTYRLARVEDAALVAATGDDETNTNVAFTVREISSTVPIVTVASRKASTDILELAGSNHVLLLGEMLGQALARRADASDAVVLTVGRFGELCIGEISVGRTSFAGLEIRESALRERYGVTIAGLWDRGRFYAPRPETVLRGETVAILVGSEEQLAALDADLMSSQRQVPSGPVLVIGGGRVGRSAAATLQQRGVSYRVLERDPNYCPVGDERYVLGDASELEVLQEAGLMQAPTVIITTQNDDTNIYLTIYCNRLRPDIQIICRSTHERNVETLHRAGADFVMSYASLGAGTIVNLLSGRDLLMVAEGLNLVRMPTPPGLVGQSIARSALRARTGCSIVAVVTDEGTVASPPPDTVLGPEMELILIGTVEAEQQLFECFGSQAKGRG